MSEALMALPGAAWPVFVTLALAVTGERVAARRRRRALNERLHELRRPLQALVLAAKGPRAPAGAPDPLDLALAALRDLDRVVNGRDERGRVRTIEARMLAVAAAERWRPRAARAGRRLGIRWLCGEVRAQADPVRVSQALDNLILNSLEHGTGAITIEGIARDDGVEIRVRDAGWMRPPGARRRRDPRRGHGLRVTREIAAGLGGEVRLRTGARASVAAITLPSSAAAGG